MKPIAARFAIVTWLAICIHTASAAEPEATIHVHADQHTGTISPYTLGACIEDVNHEIYGGLYSQMIFGQSFQEPAVAVAPAGFAAFGGSWQAEGGELQAGAGDGPKLIADGPNVAAGEASVDIFFADKKAGNAGLIVKVTEPAVGADKFTGYEIALMPDGGGLLLGRHRQNWEPIRTIPCDVPTGQWLTLTVRLGERTVEALVGGRSLLKYEDQEHPLAPGKIGLRTWQREARFRNLRINDGHADNLIRFADSPKTADAVSGMWRLVRRGEVHGQLSIVTDRPFVGSQCQRLAYTSGSGEIGVENQGLNRWGMSFQAGKPYEAVVWARAAAPVAITAALETADGAKVLAEKRIDVQQGDWQRIDFQLTPGETATAGRLTLSLRQLGTVDLGYVSLQPGEWGRFKGLPVRKDVADALVAQGLTVLRYGGSMINAPEYRWKQMIGPRDRRQPYKGTWYPYSTNGWGIVDFLSFCEAAGFLAIPDFNIDETPQDMADFVEYVNGPADSPWGRRRVADGHAAPFALKYIQLGNEEAVNEAYWQKIQPLAEAIWRADPSITPVVGDFAYGKHIADPYDFPGAPNIKSLAAHKKILDFARSQQKPVWFDVHIWNDNPRDCDPQLVVLGELIDWLAKLSPEADFKVCVFEENSGNHLLRRGLAHARTVNGLERFGGRVPIVCAANCLQPDGQNDNGWDQGLLFLSPSKVWAQPSYYVTQMIAKSNWPQGLKVDCQSPAGALDATARLSADGKLLAVQVVNVDNRPLTTRLRIDGFELAGKTAHVSEIKGELNEGNTADDPERIMPRDRVWQLPENRQPLEYIFPPQSFTVLRFE